jgi:hypothetical protein
MLDMVKTIEMDEKVSLGRRLQHDISSRFLIIVEPSLCIAFGSCEIIAPKVFEVEKNEISNPRTVISAKTMKLTKSTFPMLSGLLR